LQGSAFRRHGRSPRAQQKSMSVIGLLGFGPPDPGAPNVAAFRQGLRELGYIEDRNILIEYRWAEGKPERFPILAAELVALKVDVMVTAGGTLAALAAKRATTTLPIVFAVVGDPVAEGLVTSLARPGKQRHGSSNVTTDLVGKWLELLKQAGGQSGRPSLEAGFDARQRQRGQAEGGRRLGAGAGGAASSCGSARSADFDRAFSEMSAKGASALVVLPTPAFEIERQRIVDLAVMNRLPTVYASRNYVDIGGLMSYGPNSADLHRRAATYVDKILKGAKPSDLPVQQPTKYELMINLKTAKSLGLTVLPTLLGPADEVIE